MARKRNQSGGSGGSSGADLKKVLNELGRLKQSVNSISLTASKHMDSHVELTKIVKRLAVDSTVKSIHKQIENEVSRRKGWKNFWIPIISFISSVLALVVSVVSLIVANEMATKSDLVAALPIKLSSCVKFDGENVPVSTIQDVVLTNNGRLPITILDVFDAHSEDSGVDGDFYWKYVGAVGDYSENKAFSLDVGEAAAVRVFVPGNVQYVPVDIITSDGKRQSLKMPSSDAVDHPESLKRIFSSLPSCDQIEK